MIKIESRQGKTTGEKPFIGLNVAIPDHSPGRYVLTVPKSELNRLLI
jgi:hypothetical protein